MSRLKDEQTVIVNIGNIAGLSVLNLTGDKVLVYVDCQDSKGNWSALTGERLIAGGSTFERTRAELGHDQVRVGVRGPDDGRDLVEVTP
ncbi:MAG TPA: hypothetical protein VHY18_10405 [Solirubrobacteraceae bacterium]|jgi:hypothetical protein|nr:hypothetical protein [Solirubrobacteraceae bacterium]